MITVPIDRPPWTALGKRLESTFRKALFYFEMLKDVSKIAIALSGGKDSLTLLFLLKAISGRGFPSLDIHAIHVSG
jgi:tRNA(Ile)-lysidine synthase TilS/MesJ